jgi:hypothetical protein
VYLSIDLSAGSRDVPYRRRDIQADMTNLKSLFAREHAKEWRRLIKNVHYAPAVIHPMAFT